MEVCGTHTEAISKFGLRDLLSKNINLISGPGCPVCVTHSMYIDYLCELSSKKDIVLATYGDMVRVPGTNPNISLSRAKALGGDIRVVYSSIDAVKIAEKERGKKVVFVAIGFETTIAHTAVAIREAINNHIENFYIISMHKKIEPAMKNILEVKDLPIHGFLCPGHVASIIGEEGFRFLESYKSLGVITGFTLEEVLMGIASLIKMIKNEEFGVENKYRSVVRKEGNKIAMELINEFFKLKDDHWRGIGSIAESRFVLKDNYGELDIEKIYPMNSKIIKEDLCECGEVLMGKIKPNQCKMFKVYCTPENPIGPCMVSREGSCATYYKYL